MRQSSHVAEQSLHHPMLARGDEVSTGSKFTLGIKFPVRTERDFEMMHISRVATPIAFGDVRWHRDGGSPHLMRQSEPLTLRKRFGDRVNQIGEVDRLLPGNEVPIDLDVRHGDVESNLRALRDLVPDPFTNPCPQTPSP